MLGEFRPDDVFDPNAYVFDPTAFGLDFFGDQDEGGA